MLFIQWAALRFIFGGFTLIALLVWAYRSLKEARKTIRIPLRIASGLLLGVSAPIYLLFCALFLASTLNGCETYGPPIYSPDGAKAARIETGDSGALGGDTAVRLYAAHGFNTDAVYFGGWRSVEQKDVHWRGTSELELHYQGAMQRCESTRAVKVRCIQKNDKGAQP